MRWNVNLLITEFLWYLTCLEIQWAKGVQIIFQVVLVATCPDVRNLCWPKSWACLWTWLRQDANLPDPRQVILRQPSWSLGAGRLGLAGRGVWRLRGPWHWHPSSDELALELPGQGGLEDFRASIHRHRASSVSDEWGPEVHWPDGPDFHRSSEEDPYLSQSQLRFQSFHLHGGHSQHQRSHWFPYHQRSATTKKPRAKLKATERTACFFTWVCPLGRNGLRCCDLIPHAKQHAANDNSFHRDIF